MQAQCHITENTRNEYNPLSPSGVMPGRQFTAATPTKEQFTSKERDAETGLDYFGARYYHPAYGRWNGVDARADDMPAWSPYNYTFNNPLNLIDPDGKMATCPECKHPSPEKVSNAVANKFVTNVKAAVNLVKAKAISISAKLGITSKASDKIDVANIGFEATFSDNGVSTETQFMGVSGGGKFNESGQSPLLGVAGLFSFNPENGSFDLSLPVNANGVKFNIGHNANRNDSKFGFGITIKNVFDFEANTIFNFRENLRQSNQMNREAEKQLEKVIKMEDEF